MPKETILNCLTQRFTDKLSERAYTKKNNKQRRKMNIIMLIVILIYSIINNITYSLMQNVDPSIHEFKMYNTITSYVTTGIFAILLLVSILIKRSGVQYWVSNLGFYFLIFTNMMFRIFFLYIKVDTYIFSLIYSMQFLFRLSWLYFGLLDFLEQLCLTIALSITDWAYLGYFVPLRLHFRFSINTVSGLISLIIAYFYLLERRKSFYYNRKLRKFGAWHSNLLDNTNNGFIRIINDRIDMVNKAMMKNIMKNRTILEAFFSETLCNEEIKNERTFVFNNSKLILKELFRGIKFDVDSYNEMTNSVDDIKIVKKYLEERTQREELCYLGMLEVDSIEGPAYFEIFGRYYLSSILDGFSAHNYELMFNNVTNIKTTENANAELKYKSIFLSKVAHEFKNPLLCIKELVNELLDYLSQSNLDASVRDLLDNINSMSDYLIILIKDMDYFSAKNLGRLLTIERDKVDLNGLIHFCRGVTVTLLKKFNKEDRVTFQVVVVDLPSTVYTDEVKLKQILVNLLSNAVKFTMNGSIMLALKHTDRNTIEFSISDTGIGISKELQVNLFKPFVKTNSGNTIGTGLGLSIVKDLLEALNSHIEYTTSHNTGTTFIFNILIDKPFDMLVSSLPSNDLDITQVKDFEPIFSYKDIKEGMVGLKTPRSEENGANKTILVVDDEVTTRKSTIRLLRQYFKRNNLNIEIQEASDGIECLYLYYNTLNNGKELALIVSDQTMTFMSGTTCAEVLHDVIKGNGLRTVPFVILTAYELSSINVGNSVLDILTKPLTNNSIEKLVKYLD
jgi:signal transduction histidine kinase/CheY-like chemotaxis protein